MSTNQTSPWRLLAAQMVERVPPRKEPRYPAHGTVTVVLDRNGIRLPVRCELVDISSTGCRVRHPYGPLQIGELVSIFFDLQERPMRVVWNRQSGDAVESGFFSE